MDIKNGVDVSSFLLVEESADSEVDSLTCYRHMGIMAADEDDAESCSCDTSEIQDVLQEGFHYDHDKDENFSEIGDGSDDHQRQRSLSCCNMWWPFPDAATALAYVSTEQEEEEEYSSWGGINNHISRKVKDEMEDRLFWETCMALGYP